MASFLHIAEQHRARRLLRIGIPAARHRLIALDGAALRGAVLCVPVAPHVPLSAGWLGELRPGHRRSARAIEFRISDGEAVWLRYDEREFERMTAAEAVAFFLWTADARGFEVLVPRAILPREIAGLRALPLRSPFAPAGASHRSGQRSDGKGTACDRRRSTKLRRRVISSWLCPGL